MTAPRLLDRVKETITTEGTGSYTVSAAVAIGYRGVATAFANGETGIFAVEDGIGGYEVFVGTYTSPTTLARTTILRSSNSNLAVNWGAGTKTLACVMTGEYADMVRMKHNLVAGGAPTANDDAGDGYRVGSIWVYGTSVYICTTETLAAAVWSLAASSLLQIEDGTSPTLSGGALLVIGASALASADNAIAIGGGASATATTAIALGQTAQASGGSAVAIGTNAIGQGVNSVALGATTQASGAYAVAIGSGSAVGIGSAVLAGGDAAGNGQATVSSPAKMAAAIAGYATFVEHPFDVATGAGDGSDHYVHRSDLVMWRLTSDATPTYAQFLNDVATYGAYSIGTGYAIGFEAQIVARSSTEAKFWKITGFVVRNTAGNITVVGTPTVTVVAETAGATTWAAAFSVDTGTQALRFDHTGQAATTISWCTVVRSTKVENYL